MSVYLLAAIDKRDLETYSKYEAGGFESIAKYGPKGLEALAVCDAPKLVEGELPGHRIVLLRFKDQQLLDEWYNSPEYQRALPYRQQAADTKFLITFAGLDG